ncbi:hypothetical protein, partial [Subtercola sp. RTI3]|uniref:hypothetical protein n=1 Tax=Subtercola sp. RTI3 TaxID=3048639 RepID=UPI002B22658E
MCIRDRFWVGVFVMVFSLAARRRRRFWAANGGALGQGGFGHPRWARPGWGGSGGPHAWAGGEPAGWAAPSAAVNPAADAEKTLAGRFAVGDIDEVEYRARLEVLRANRPVDPTPNGS